jgi:preprotein translocase subunit YajC
MSLRRQTDAGGAHRQVTSNLYSLLLLAQGAADNAAPEAAPQQPPGPGLAGILIYAVPIMVLWYVMFIRPQTRERAQRQEMLNALKNNDSVVTIGGILGTVSHISEDGKEVTLRIDDNARIRVRREAISEVRKDTSKAES